MLARLKRENNFFWRRHRRTHLPCADADWHSEKKIARHRIFICRYAARTWIRYCSEDRDKFFCVELGRRFRAAFYFGKYQACGKCVDERQACRRNCREISAGRCSRHRRICLRSYSVGGEFEKNSDADSRTKRSRRNYQQNFIQVCNKNCGRLWTGIEKFSRRKNNLHRQSYSRRSFRRTTRGRLEGI